METKHKQDPGCLFCKFVAKKIPLEVIYEDDDILAFLDIAPINPGHTLVIPKDHYNDLFDLPNDILKKISVKLRDIGASIKEAVGAEGLNLGMNNRPAAGQLINHAHFHLIPRYFNDKRKHWKGRKYEVGEIEKVAKKIRKSIES